MTSSTLARALLCALIPAALGHPDAARAYPIDLSSFDYTVQTYGGDVAVIEAAPGFSLGLEILASDVAGFDVADYISDQAAPQAMTIHLEWVYVTQGLPADDVALVYSIDWSSFSNPIFTEHELSDPDGETAQSGAFSFDVAAGEHFGFGVSSLGDSAGPATVTYQLRAESSPVPLPAAGLLLIGGLGALSLARKRS